VVGTLATPL